METKDINPEIPQNTSCRINILESYTEMQEGTIKQT